MIIRPAVPADVGAIADILRELEWFPQMMQEPPEATRERVARHLALCGADESHTVLVGEDGRGEVLGYVAVHWLPYLILAGPEGYVSELFVRKAARGQGVGRRLLDEIVEQAVARGCFRLMLLNGKERPSYQRGFYGKLGWEERPQHANFVLWLPRAE